MMVGDGRHKDWCPCGWCDRQMLVRLADTRPLTAEVDRVVAWAKARLEEKR